MILIAIYITLGDHPPSTHIRQISRFLAVRFRFRWPVFGTRKKGISLYSRDKELTPQTEDR